MKGAPSTSEILLYQTGDNLTRIEVKLDGETVWLSQAQMAELFQTTPQNITQHLSSIYREGELAQESTCKPLLQVRHEGAREVRRQVAHYSLDAIIAVGYRVKSHRGTQFRIWATQRLQEYLIKGFTLDDHRLKASGGGNYFDELLAQIRDIRSSEKVFWRKVLDIFATSIDYDGQTELAKTLFATVQNKIHYAAHGHTAAEIVAARADADRPNMGLTSFAGSRPRKGDVGVAKNYLQSDELELLNRIVTAYLEFAELQALSRRPMYMKDWRARLDEFLKLTGRDLLNHAGSVSHEVALAKAAAELERFEARTLSEPSIAERDLEALSTTATNLQRQKKGKTP